MNTYPPEAYAPNGQFWWHLDHEPGGKRAFGDEKKIAAYLASTKSVGDTFTTRELRQALGKEGKVNTAEHFQRRIRALRGERDGWDIASFQDDRTLPPEHYRVDKIGWHPAVGPRAADKQTVTAKTRSLILERDGSRCQVCGIGDGEPYPEGGGSAVMTIGHIVPQYHGGSNDPGNLRVECSRCNETKRAEGTGPEPYEVVWTAVRKLPTPQLRRLNEWLSQGVRTRDKLDEAYDRVRKMPPDDKEHIVAEIRRMLGD